MKFHRDRRWTEDILSLFPGELAVSRDSIITTVLGTCVAVVLFSVQDKIGGMNHFMLPQTANKNIFPISQSQEGRYGVNAMELLINALMKEGIPKNRLSAKVFGGGKMFSPGEGANPHHIGIQNVLFVQEFLEAEKIPVISEDVTGSGARRIYFFPWNGKVLLKRYQNISGESLNTPEYLKQEQRLLNSLEIARDSRVIIFDQSSTGYKTEIRE